MKWIQYKRNINIKKKIIIFKTYIRWYVFIQILSKKEINSCVNIIISFCEFYIFPNAYNIDNNYSNTKFFVFSYTHTQIGAMKCRIINGMKWKLNIWHFINVWAYYYLLLCNVARFRINTKQFNVILVFRIIYEMCMKNKWKHWISELKVKLCDKQKKKN